MTSEKLYEVLGDMKEDYVEGAKKPMKTKKKINFKILGAMAACLCLVAVGVTTFNNTTVTNKPNPESVQVISPILEVNSVEEMESYLDFEIPTLDKEVDAYIVMVIDEYPRSARIEYKDGSTFNMEHGTGDISGIYGGTFERKEMMNDVTVNFYSYFNETENMRYALWEKDGFTYSLSGADTLEEEIQFLTK